MNLTWRNEPDGYAVATLTTTGAVLAIAQTDAPGPVQWGSRWIAEGGHRESATLQIDGQTARVLQGEKAGQGLLVVWASANGILSNELVLMLLGAGAGSASTGNADTDTDTGTDNASDSDGGSNSGDSGDSGGSANALALLPIQGQARLSLTAVGNLHSVKPLQAKAKLRLIARHGTAQPPSGLGMQMKIIADPYRPEVILDQSLWVWFNGQPSQCRIALKMDDSVEFQPAFVWQNPGVTQPAILKIDSAAIAGDGQSHRIKVSVWQAVGNRTSARATLSDYAKTPTVRPATQPAWCGATPIRQGETLYSAPYTISGYISDLTRIDWRHTGAVQIMAKVPVANEKAAGFHSSIVTLGYADHDETTFAAEAVGLLIGWRNGLLHEVLFGVASIHHGQFGPVTWANAPVNIREILHRPAGPPLTPDEQAGTARVLRLDGMKDEIGQAIFAEQGWTYPGYPGSSAADTKRRDIVNTTIDKALRKIKDLIRRGGRVILDDLGRFEARWNETRTVRSVGFVASPGFIAGAKAGYPLTDAQAKALP